MTISYALGMNIFTNKADKFVIPTHKLYKVLFDPRKKGAFYENTAVAVRTGGTKSKPVEIFAALDFQSLKMNGANIPESNRLTLYDREVLNAVISLYSADNQYISPNMILNVLSGNKVYKDGTRKSITADNRNDIISSIERMRQTSITVDTSQESLSFHKDVFKYTGSLLPCRPVNGVLLNNNPAKDCYHILRCPPLLEYSRLRKQLTSADIALLGVLTNRRAHIQLKGYLLSELLWMKYSTKRKPVIRYDTLLEYLSLKLSGNNDDVIHQRKILRDNVKKCLNYWINMKIIKGYTEDKERNLFSKISIRL